MKAYELGDRRHGALTLRITERPDPVAGPGEVVMKVHATGLGARDIRIMKSALPTDGIGVSNAPAPERIPLQDSAGEIISVGSGVTRVKVGDRVMATHYPLYIDGKWHVSMFDYDFGNIADGFLAEQALLPADCLVKIPESLSYEEASTLQSSGLTPWRALAVEGKLQAGDTVLILGTGNVSIFGLQIAKILGARVVMTSSSDERLETMRALGADITVNYRTNPKWEDEVLAKTEGQGADVVLNTIGFSGTEKSLLCCASNGRVLLVGAGGEPAVLTSFPNMIRKDLTIMGFTVGSRRMFEDFVRAVEYNRLKPVIDRIFKFDEIFDAVEYYQTGQKVGKVVINIQ